MLFRSIMPPKLKETKNKSKRRGNNEGSIYQRKSDNNWCGTVTVGYDTAGKPKRKTLYGNSEQEVLKKMHPLVGNVLANGYTTVSARQERNFKVLFAEWFDLFVVPNLASITEESRRGLLKTHVYPVFEKYDVQDIDTVKLQKFFNDKVKLGLCTDTISKTKNLLNNFFTYATRNHFININPMLDIKIKYKRNDSGEKQKALRQEIRQQVFAWVSENPILKPIVITFAFTGLRPQELIALEWKTVNFANRTLSVTQAINKQAEFDDEGNVISRSAVVGKTKTKKSVRTIIMPDAVMAVLREWLTYCEENNINSTYVFPNTKTGELRTYSGLRSMLERFVKSHKLQDEHITLYTFRHTFATVLLEERENPRIVADLMGHVKASTTLNIYSHVVNNSVYEETAQTLDGVFSKICNL